MCGITGGWWPSGSQHVAERLERSLDAMKHRGPDDRGKLLYQLDGATTALGHMRLSIIDVSSAGHQPMSSTDDRLTVVFNGEIYNYRELKKELEGLGHKFSSGSDTEVLLAAWKQWGTACLPRLTGMFAFAMLDRQEKTLTCVRDAFGIKPFFYSNSDDGFHFGSETGAVLELQASKPAVNWQRAYDYLVHGDYDSNSESFFEGIHHLMPGHFLTLDLTDGKVTPPESWWRPDIRERRDLGFSGAVEKIRQQFLDNVRLHLRSDVPLGSALSGGVDSSSIVCAMRHLEPDLPIHTFSFIAAGSDVSEEHWVDQINDRVKAISHKVVVTPQDLAKDLDDMIRVQGEPFGSTSIYAQYCVYRLAKESGITVTLDGQGADEMLAGYSGYPGPRLHSLIQTGQWKRAWRFLNDWSTWPGRSKAAGAKAWASHVAGDELHRLFRSVNGGSLKPAWLKANELKETGVEFQFSRRIAVSELKGRQLMAELAASLTERGIVSLLRNGDRNSMRFSIESRVPFLTTDLVETLMSVPEEYLISDQGETKHIFRAAMRGIVPDAVLDRRDKIGFATPEKAWLFALSDTVRGWLGEDIEIPFINRQEMLSEFDQIISGKRPFTWQVWRWINFCRWYGHYVVR